MQRSGGWRRLTSEKVGGRIFASGIQVTRRLEDPVKTIRWG